MSTEKTQTELNKQESVITAIHLNDNSFNNKTIYPVAINYFFGNNGVGKTTISETIAKDEDGVVEYNSDPSLSKGKFQLLVFNRDFVSENLKFDGFIPGVFTVNKENNVNEAEIDNLKKEQKTLNDEISEDRKSQDKEDKQFKKDTKQYQQNIFNATKDLREPYQNLLGTVMRPSSFSRNLDEQIDRYDLQPVQHDLSDLKKRHEIITNSSAQELQSFKTINPDGLSNLPGEDILQKIITSSGDTPFAEFIKSINAGNWLKSSHEMFHGKTNGYCPYCHQELPDDIEEKIASCFDDQYEKDMAALNSFLQTYKDTANSIFKTLLDNNKINIGDIDRSTYSDKLSIAQAAIQRNIDAIKKKIEHPNDTCKLEDVTAPLQDVCTAISDINKKVDTRNHIIRNQKNEKKKLTADIWQMIYFTIKADVQSYRMLLGKHLAYVNTAQNNFEKKNNRLTEIQKEIQDKSAKLVNTQDAIDIMNTYIRDSGFQGFHIEVVDGYPNHYHVVRDNGQPAKHLSEGEKNFIAFLYFMTLVRGNGKYEEPAYIPNDHTEDPSADQSDMRDKIVVIDDPVSSMDNNALFIISSLVRGMVDICRNAQLLESEREDGKQAYIRQIFIMTHNAFFHQEIAVLNPDDYHFTNFYLITKQNNDSNVKLCVHQDPARPADDCNYNPVRNNYAALWTEFQTAQNPVSLMNVARRILEYYFVHLCGYTEKNLEDRLFGADNRSNFVTTCDDGTENTTKLRLAKAMMYYIYSNDFGLYDGLDFSIEATDMDAFCGGERPLVRFPAATRRS